MQVLQQLLSKSSHFFPTSVTIITPNTPPPNVFQAAVPPQIRPTSILDCDVSKLNTMHLLFRDKRAAKVLVRLNTVSASFLLSARDGVADVNMTRVHPMMMRNFNFLLTNCRKGAAIENKTFLGTLLHFAPSANDPAFQELFKDPTKQSRQSVDAKIHEMRNKQRTLLQSTSDLILILLKCGGDVKVKTLTWLKSAVLENIEAEKDQPSPLLCASSGFLLNLSHLMLNLVEPILDDGSKLAKIDSGFLYSGAGDELFPRSLTGLVPSDLFTRSATDTAVTGEKGEKGEKGEEYSFVTQSFFLCWRAIHLGIVPLCNRYKQLIQGLNHHWEGLQSNEPQALHYFWLKLVIDIHFLEPTLVRKVLQFTSASSDRLMSWLQTTDTYTRDTIDSHVWLLSPSDMTEAQQKMLARLPEHFIDDLMTVTLFIAKASPLALRDCNLEPVLTLVVWLLRRPWAIQSPHLRAKLGQVIAVLLVCLFCCLLGLRWCSRVFVHSLKEVQTLY